MKDKFIKNCIFCKFREDCPTQYHNSNSACITIQEPLVKDTYEYEDVIQWLYLSKEEMKERLECISNWDYR